MFQTWKPEQIGKQFQHQNAWYDLVILQRNSRSIDRTKAHGITKTQVHGDSKTNTHDEKQALVTLGIVIWKILSQGLIFYSRYHGMSEEVAWPESIIKAMLFYWQLKLRAQTQSWCLATELDQ